MAQVRGYLNYSIELPNLEAQEDGRELIGERARTAGGKLRQDLVAVKRTWQLTLRHLAPEQHQAIITYLDSAGWGAVPFWIDSLGGSPADSISALVELTSCRRVQFGGRHGWVSDGRTIELTVKEQ